MSTIAVTGVVYDGPVAPGVPKNSRVTFEMMRGEIPTVDVTVLRASGAPFDLTEAEVFLTIKQKLSDASAVLIVADSPLATAKKGKATFAVSTIGTLVAGRYFLEITVMAPSGRFTAIPASPLIVHETLRTVS